MNKFLGVAMLVWVFISLIAGFVYLSLLAFIFIELIRTVLP